MKCPNCQTVLAKKNTRWVDPEYDKVSNVPLVGWRQMCSNCVATPDADHDIYGRLRPSGPRWAVVQAEADAWYEAKIEPRLAEYTEWLKVWIVKRNAEYIPRADKLKGTTPLRHKAVVDEVTRLWLDAIWCQDITLSDCPSEFFQADWWDFAEGSRSKEQTESIYNDRAQDALNECFDKAFREAMPKNLHHVVEG